MKIKGIDENGNFVVSEINLERLKGMTDQFYENFEKKMKASFDDEELFRYANSFFYEISRIITYLHAIDYGMDLGKGVFAHGDENDRVMEVYFTDQFTEEEKEGIVSDPETFSILENMFLIAGINPLIIEKRTTH